MANKKAHCDNWNKGVKCDVRNCVYHDGNSTCNADKIQVGPNFAVSSADTVCSTFKPHSDVQ